MNLDSKIIELNHQKKYEELINLVENTKTEEVKKSNKIKTTCLKYNRHKLPDQNFAMFPNENSIKNGLFYLIFQLIDTATRIVGQSNETFISYWDAILIATDNLTEKRFKVIKGYIIIVYGPV